MSKSWHDPRVPPPEDCVLQPLLDRRACEMPDKVFARFADGSEWTYRQTRDDRAAHGDRPRGARRGAGRQGPVVAAQRPGRACASGSACNYLGAVYVPINLAYRGGLLAHVVENSDARLIVAHADLCGRLADIDRAALTTAVVLGGDARADAGPRGPSARER